MSDVIVSLFLIVSVFGVVGFILWVWALIDCLLHETDEGNNRLIWMLVVILTNIIGALIYLILRRPMRVGQGKMPRRL